MTLAKDSPKEQSIQTIQAVRVVNKAGLPVYEPSAQSEIFYIACHYDADSQRNIILWDDVLDAFRSVIHVRDGTRILSFLTGPDLKSLEPLRIAAVLGSTLNVVIGGHLARLRASSTIIVAESAIQYPTCKCEQYINTEANPEVNSTIHFIPSSTQTASIVSVPATSDVEKSLSESASTVKTPTEELLVRSSNNLDTSAPLPGNNAADSDTLKPASDQPRQSSSPSTTTAITNTQEYVGVLSAIADMYESGVGQDYQKAMEWSLRAANLGHPPSQCRLGLLYKKGNGCLQDYDKAKEWFMKAADQGFSSAQYNIGELYYFGHGVPKDYTQAIGWYLKAAEQGHLSAKYSLGCLYSHCDGALQDYSKAMEWFLNAARCNHASAQYKIGELYYYGLGVSKDVIIAKEWYLKAADQNSSSAQYALGDMYFYGRGVSKDRIEAMEWYKKAGRQGHEQANHDLMRLEALYDI